MPSKIETPQVLTKETIGGLAINSVAESEALINMIIYAESGTGKTILAGSSDAVAEMSPVLIADVEGGTFSLRAFYPNVKSVRIKSWDDIATLYNELRRGDHPFKTIVIDSLTELQKVSMTTIMAEVIKHDADRDPEVPSVREWGKNAEQIRRVVRAFRDLPMNTIFTALVADDKDPKSGKTTYRPSLPGKLAKEVPGYVDLCLYMYRKELPDPEQEGKTKNSRLLLSSATEQYVCKDRSNNLPPVLVEPTMAEIWSAIHKHN
jgi:hypothetical protein